MNKNSNITRLHNAYTTNYKIRFVGLVNVWHYTILFVPYIYHKIHEIVLLVGVRDSSSIASLFIDIADFTLIYTFSFLHAEVILEYKKTHTCTHRGVVCPLLYLSRVDKHFSHMRGREGRMYFSGRKGGTLTITPKLNFDYFQKPSPCLL